MNKRYFHRALSSLGVYVALSGGFNPRASGGDWPRLLGPNHDCKATASDSRDFWSASSLKQEWAFPKGKGWAPPVVTGGRVLLFHRIEKEEVLDCLDLNSGSSLWRMSYEAPYRDRYGSGDGCRTSPVVSGEKAWVFGITGILHCVDLRAGRILWKRDLGADYAMRDNFFGHGSTPLVLDGKVIVPVGGSDERCVVALDTDSGKEVWVATHSWGAGYASAIPARYGNGSAARSCILLFTGGETRPPSGGLLCLDSSSGKVLGEISHRARIAESVNAASPVLVSPNKVLTTEAYGSGTILSEICEDGSLRKLWGTLKLGSQFLTPIARDGCVLGFDGQNSRLAELVCLDAVTGEERWREDFGGRFGRGNLVDLGEHGVLALGESGELIRFKPTHEKAEVIQRESLFEAPETWSIPVLAGRRFLVMQNERAKGGRVPSLVCYSY